MRISKLSYHNFKGLNGWWEPKPLNLLVGPNGSGKTARIEAIRWAITGITSLGGRSDDAMMLMGPGGGAVAVELDWGFGWRRMLSKDARTRSISTILEVTGSETLALKKAERKLADVVGDFAPMFDLGAFLSLSPDKRRDFVIQLCAKHATASAVDADKFEERLLREFLTLETGTETANVLLAEKGTLELAFGELAGPRREAVEAIVAQLRPEIKGSTLSAIAATVDKARELANASREQRNQAIAAARKLSEQINALPAIGETLEKLRIELGEQRLQHGNLAEMLGRAQGAATSLTADKRAVAELEATVLLRTDRLNCVKEAVAALPPLTDAEKMEAEAAALGIDTPQDDTVKELGEKLEQARSAWSEADRLETEQASICRATEIQVAELQAQVKSMEGSAWIRALDAYTACDVAMVADLRAPITEIQTDWPAEWSKLGTIIREEARPERLDQYRLQLITAESRRRGAEAQYQPLGEAAKVASQAVDGAQRELLDARVAHQLLYDASVKAQKRHAELTEEASSIRFRHGSRQGDLAAAVTALGEAAEEHLAAQKRLDELRVAVGTADTGDIERQQGATNELIRELEARINSKQKIQTLEEELRKCVASSERELVGHEVAVKVGQALRVLREQYMANTITPLRKHLDVFLALAKPGTETYCGLISDRDQATFDLGWIRNERQVSLPAMSSGESALYCAGLLYAMVRLADAPLSLLMIQAGELDAEHLTGLQRALGRLAPEHISNVIVETCLPVAGTTEGFVPFDCAQEVPEPQPA